MNAAPPSRMAVWFLGGGAFNFTMGFLLAVVLMSILCGVALR